MNSAISSEHDDVCAFLVHENVTDHRTVDLQTHQRTEVVAVRERVLPALAGAQQRQRSGQLCALGIHVIRIKQIDPAFRVLIAAPEQRMTGRSGKAHRIRAQRPLLEVEELGMGQITALLTRLLLVEQSCQQQLIVAAVCKRGQDLLLGLQGIFLHCGIDFRYAAYCFA